LSLQTNFLNLILNYIFWIVLAFPIVCFGQDSNRTTIIPDTGRNLLDSIPVKDSVQQIVATDSLVPIVTPVAIPAATKQNRDSILSKNRFLNLKSPPVYFIQKERPTQSHNILFYFLAGLFLIFAILKTWYPKYTNTLWRVFFNTSMRQSQLSEQLRQSNLPSFFFNLFFIFSASWYVYMLLYYFHKTRDEAFWVIPGIVSVVMLAIYIGKFLILKFMGWVTGYRDEANDYIFIVFLINKVLGIALLPLIVIIAFGGELIGYSGVIASFVLLGLMTLMRFIRSYGVFQRRFKISSFHFLIYIIGMEIIPILVLYKFAAMYLSKNV